MLELARERAATLGLGNLRFVETDAETLAVEELGFNAATLSREHLISRGGIHRRSFYDAELERQ
jgi:hypothetical protein